MIEETYFDRKRRQLGMDRMDTLATIQVRLEEMYPGSCRARQVHQGTLMIVTASSLVAGELRWRQEELLTYVRAVDGTVVRIQIRIGQLSST